MKDKTLYIYYSFLILFILVGIYMPTVNPVFRLLFLAMVIIPPMFYRIDWFAPVFSLFFFLSNVSFSSPILPTDPGYYIALAAIGAILNNKIYGEISNTYKVFIFFSIYSIIINFLTSGNYQRASSYFIIGGLLFFCLLKHPQKTIELLPRCFIMLTFVLSFWQLFVPEARMNTYNTVADMSQETWLDPNYLTCQIGIGTFLAIRSLIKEKPNGIYTLFLSIVIILSFVAMLTIASRGGIMTTLVSTALVILFSESKKTTKMLIIVAIAIFGIWLNNNDYFDFVISRFQIDDGTGAHRTEIWGDKILCLFNSDNLLNIIFGFGESGGYELGTISKGRAFHNDFVAFIVEYGIVGFCSFLYLLSVPIIRKPLKVAKEVLPLLLYLVLYSFSIEPLSRGSLVWMGLYSYTVVLSEQLKNSVCIAKKE